LTLPPARRHHKIILKFFVFQKRAAASIVGTSGIQVVHIQFTSYSQLQRHNLNNASRPVATLPTNAA
jgi:hypothetical protein